MTRAAALALFHELRPVAARFANKRARRFPHLREELRQAVDLGLWELVTRRGITKRDVRRVMFLRLRGAAIDELREHDPAARSARRNGTAPTYPCPRPAALAGDRGAGAPTR